MLTIRAEQMGVLDQAARKRFEDEMVAHLKGFTPEHSEVLGEPGVRRLIGFAVERAGGHGFRLRGPIRFYLELILMIGSDFDTDPQFPWAAEALGAADTSDELERADRLHALALQYVDAVGGPDFSHARAALRRAADEPLADAPPADAPGYEDHVLGRMRSIYPEKYEYVSAAGLRPLIPRGKQLARAHGVTGDRGAMIFIGLMFALGHGFAADPQFPWIEATLGNPAITDPETRADRVLSKARTYLDHVLKFVDRR